MNSTYRVGVLGLGREGLEVLKFLNSAGIKPVGLDGRELSTFAAPVQRQLKRLASELWLGPTYLEEVGDLDIVFRSPGVPLDLPQLRKAKRKGVVMSSLMQIFFELCPAKIIGVTGTKGKSTTVKLIHHLLKGQLSGKVYLGGNIGVPPLKLLPRLSKKDWVILELSSFQLEDLAKSPNISVLLNVVSEHLDRHKKFEKYLSAKSNLFIHQSKKDWLISSADHPITRLAIRKAVGKKLSYSIRKILPRGLYLVDGAIIYRHPKTRRRIVLCKIEQIPLLGQHNLENVLAALAVVLIVGLKPAGIVRRLNKFKSLAHRLELVGTLGGVQFINDSLATTPESAEASVLTFAQSPKALIWGGVSGGGNWLPVVRTVGLAGVEYVALIGTMAKKLKSLLKKMAPKVKTEIHPTFSGAIQGCYKAVKRGGVVIMSPGAKSFDMFKDAYDRGDQFKKLVKELINQHNR